jgi:DNA repair protein RecN (Recombination protein N)
MLLKLEIKNFILIDYHNIIFKKGFTTITGETGAGKSIILDAIHLLMGSRMDNHFQKNKERKTEIISEFDISNLNIVKNILNNNDLNDEEQPNILNIRRTISNGKSNCYINSIKCPLLLLKNITEHLIEINSQNSNKNIVSNENQLEVVDLYCDNTKDLINLSELFDNYKEREKKLELLKKEQQEQSNKKELLSYKLNELKELDIQEDEYINLEKKYKMLSSAESLKESCVKSLAILEGNNLHNVMDLLNNMIDNENIIETKKMLSEAIINIEEVENNINNEESKVYYDEEELQSVNERMSKINLISKKHFVDPENISNFINDIENELNEFLFFDEKIEKINEEMNDIFGEWLKLSEIISKNRKKYINNLSKSITDKIKLLKMDNATFKIDINEILNKKINRKGIDEVNFLISTNLGSPFEKIKKAASGGEISRINLAIKSIISKNENKPIRIFDEVDSGIGGTTGNSIGQFLYEISKFSQVFTITHLAQVASFADNHFFVYKKDLNNITNTFIDYVENEDKLKELSRMMGYEEFNENNEKMVKKLIQNSQDKIR